MAYLLYKHLSTRILRNIQNVFYPYLNDYSKDVWTFYNKVGQKLKAKSIDIKIGVGHKSNSYLTIYRDEDDNVINLKEILVKDKIRGINTPRLPMSVMIEVDLELTESTSLHMSTNLIERKSALSILKELILEDYTFNDKELKDYWN